MNSDIYNLPELFFTGGTSKIYKINLTKNGVVYDATGCNVNFSLINYSNKGGTPVLNINGIIEVDGNGINSIASVTLSSNNTKNLQGKYIYQITIIDSYGNADPNHKGSMTIDRNINPSFISA